MSWQEVTGDDGTVYYYNSDTLETTWDKPEELYNDQEQAIARIGWKKFSSDDGSVFWYNTNTQQSVWDTPPEVQQIIDGKTDGVAQNSSEAAADSVIAAAATSIASAPAMSSGTVSNSNANGHAEMHNFRTTSKLAPNYDTVELVATEKSKEDFVQAIDALNIEDMSDWESAMEKLIDLPEYWAIPDALERKRIFDNHQINLKQLKKEHQQAMKKQNREAMREQLTKYPIKHYTRWKTMSEELASDPVFSNVEDERERRLVFTNYVRELKRQNDELKEREREKVLQELADLMRHSEIDVFTRWKDAKSIAEHSAASWLDTLTTFEDYMRELERRLNEQKQVEKKIKYRRERKNREAFLQLLEEVRSSGNSINVGTKWADILPLIEKDPRYIGICGQPGSTPIELFWDIVEEEERKLKAQREAILDILAAKRTKIEDCHSLEQFTEIIRSDSGKGTGREFSDETLRLVFDRLKRVESVNKEADRHAQERRLRRAQDDLRYAIKHLEPRVAVDDTWESVRPRIEHFSEFKAIPDDSKRRAAFDKYIQRLKDKIHDEKERERERERERQRRHRDAERISRNEQPHAQPRGLDEGPLLDY